MPMTEKDREKFSMIMITKELKEWLDSQKNGKESYDKLITRLLAKKIMK